MSGLHLPARMVDPMQTSASLCKSHRSVARRYARHRIQMPMGVYPASLDHDGNAPMIRDHVTDDAH